jgi:protein gp37
MGENSKIEWTDHTFNLVWGCQRVSPACQNCYAEAFSHRLGKDLWGPNKERQVMSESYWKQPLKWDRQAAKAGVRRRVFCSSMADVFEDHPTVNQERVKLFALIDQTPNLDWLLLTKRPENIKRLWPFGWYDDRFTWPNIWLGTTVENQEYADKRIPHLLSVPAKVRFLSCEPLLGALNLNSYLNTKFWDLGCYAYHDKIDWVICGGESGHGARPMHPDWARSLRDQCVNAGVAYHFKQWGEWSINPQLNADYGRLDLSGKFFSHKEADYLLRTQNEGEVCIYKNGKHAAGRLLDGRTWDEMPSSGDQASEETQS